MVKIERLDKLFIYYNLFVHKNVFLFILTITTLLCFVENALAQTNGRAPNVPPGVGAKPGAFPPLSGEGIEAPREPIRPTYI